MSRNFESLLRALRQKKGIRSSDAFSCERPTHIWHCSRRAIRVLICTKVGIAERIAENESLRDLFGLVVAHYGLFDKTELDTISRLLIDNKQQVSFLGDLDPLDILVASQVAETAENLGYSFNLIGINEKWIKQYRGIRRKNTINFEIRMSPAERRELQAINSFIGPWCLAQFGEAAMELLSTGVKLEAEGAAAMVGKSRFSRIICRAVEE